MLKLHTLNSKQFYSSLIHRVIQSDIIGQYIEFVIYYPRRGDSRVTDKQQVITYTFDHYNAKWAESLMQWDEESRIHNPWADIGPAIGL